MSNGTFFNVTRGLAPTRTARQPPLAGGEPLATYTRQVPFDPYEY